MRRYLLALPLLLAVLAFAACGDDSSSESEATSAPTTEAATPAPTEAATETPTEAASGGGGSAKAVKVTGKLGEKPTIEVPGGDAPTELVSKDIKVGKGPAAKAGDNVSVQYVGALYDDGTVFDNSWDRGEPFTFGLGQGQVIPGWDQGVAGMKVGGRRVLTIPAELGYGDAGAGGAIPPGATLVFVVDLEKIG